MLDGVSVKRGREGGRGGDVRRCTTNLLRWGGETLALIIDGGKKACLQLSLPKDYSHALPVMSVTLEYSTVVTNAFLAYF